MKSCFPFVSTIFHADASGSEDRIAFFLYNIHASNPSFYCILTQKRLNGNTCSSKFVTKQNKLFQQLRGREKCFMSKRNIVFTQKWKSTKHGIYKMYTVLNDVDVLRYVILHDCFIDHTRETIWLMNGCEAPAVVGAACRGRCRGALQHCSSSDCTVNLSDKQFFVLNSQNRWAGNIGGKKT